MNKSTDCLLSFQLLQIILSNIMGVHDEFFHLYLCGEFGEFIHLIIEQKHFQLIFVRETHMGASSI